MTKQTTIQPVDEYPSRTHLQKVQEFLGINGILPKQTKRTCPICGNKNDNVLGVCGDCLDITIARTCFYNLIMED
jgi:hypothetical protein